MAEDALLVGLLDGIKDLKGEFVSIRQTQNSVSEALARFDGAEIPERIKKLEADLRKLEKEIARVEREGKERSAAIETAHAVRWAYVMGAAGASGAISGVAGSLLSSLM